MTKDTPLQFGYKAFYGNKTADIYADSLYAAKRKAIEALKPPKSQQHMVSVVLAEKDGVAVPINTGSLL